MHTLTSHRWTYSETLQLPCCLHSWDQSSKHFLNLGYQNMWFERFWGLKAHLSADINTFQWKKLWDRIEQPRPTWRQNLIFSTKQEQFQSYICPLFYNLFLEKLPQKFAKKLRLWPDSANNSWHVYVQEPAKCHRKYVHWCEINIRKSHRV